MEKTILTTSQAAAILQVDTSWIRQLILSGRLPAEKKGRDWLIKSEDLDKMERPKRGPKPKYGKGPI
ncbi:DNA binding domain protein, excisionase family (plasmid) [Solidesulfovibrio carbinoliphilus subsp. oakridgensis]|uniref:DNA binding domain protein, excisionase family n=1 Tax=Solidesulfovibrio carbinoliphilus subsp. oakridgensis TaxID=694327 RepID=G7QEB0_9BACT|nr:helix-turn-helix domain-containing protein [Solidesulfovibrio carbinoliphilus]EHJ46004.1 DNA binding domain protein, excisionase family [Solidesulfovibrio carbinoliphilus subsp. oakridgensis]